VRKKCHEAIIRKKVAYNIEDGVRYSLDTNKELSALLKQNLDVLYDTLLDDNTMDKQSINVSMSLYNDTLTKQQPQSTTTGIHPFIATCIAALIKTAITPTKGNSDDMHKLMMRQNKDVCTALTEVIEENNTPDPVFPRGIKLEFDGVNAFSTPDGVKNVEKKIELCIAYAIACIIKFADVDMDEAKHICSVDNKYLFGRQKGKFKYLFKKFGDAECNGSIKVATEKRMKIEFPAIWGLTYAQLQYFGAYIHSNETNVKVKVNASNINEKVDMYLQREQNDPEMFTSILSKLRKPTQLTLLERYIIHGSRYLNSDHKPPTQKQWFYINRASYLLLLDGKYNASVYGVYDTSVYGGGNAYHHRIASILTRSHGEWSRKQEHTISLRHVDVVVDRVQSVVHIKHRGAGGARTFAFKWDGHRATVAS
jgi:hypothetical protein